MEVYGFRPMRYVQLFCGSSVKHEYEGDWKENSRLTTCDPHAKKTVSSSDSPQEVEDKKEIVFTYDAAFEVYACAILM